MCCEIQVAMASSLPPLDQETLKLYAYPAYGMSKPDTLCYSILNSLLPINPPSPFFRDWDSSNDLLENMDLDNDDSINQSIKSLCTFGTLTKLCWSSVSGNDYPFTKFSSLPYP